MYTTPQYSRARQLAMAFGHGWASVVPAEHPIPGCLWTAAFIREWYLAVCARDQLEPWQRGFSDPGEPSYSGLICHTTGTGRIAWQIERDGTVGIAVCRPGEEYVDVDGTRRVQTRVVLSAHVGADGRVAIRTPCTTNDRIPDVWSLRWSPEDGPRAEARHGDALWLALIPLVGQDAATTALAASGVQTSLDRESSPV